MPAPKTVLNPGTLNAPSSCAAVKPVKAIIFQPRKMPVFVKQTDTSSDAVFMRKKFKYGSEARGNAGYGLWQMAVGSTGTA